MLRVEIDMYIYEVPSSQKEVKLVNKLPQTRGVIPIIVTKFMSVLVTSDIQIAIRGGLANFTHGPTIRFSGTVALLAIALL